MACVCGCPESSHCSTAMSVPLIGKGKLPRHFAGSYWPPSSAQATYVRDECPCGCTIYTPDLET